MFTLHISTGRKTFNEEGTGVWEGDMHMGDSTPWNCLNLAVARRVNS